MQAIITKYHGPTNTRGSRISAKCAAGTIYVPFNHSLNPEQNHRHAADMLTKKMGWAVEGSKTHIPGLRLTGGEMPDNKGNAYVLTCKHWDGQEGADWRDRIGEEG